MKETGRSEEPDRPSEADADAEAAKNRADAAESQDQRAMSLDQIHADVDDENGEDDDTFADLARGVPTAASDRSSTTPRAEELPTASDMRAGLKDPSNTDGQDSKADAAGQIDPMHRKQWSNQIGEIVTERPGEQILAETNDNGSERERRSRKIIEGARRTGDLTEDAGTIAKSVQNAIGERIPPGAAITRSTADSPAPAVSRHHEQAASAEQITMAALVTGMLIAEGGRRLWDRISGSKEPEKNDS